MSLGNSLFDARKKSGLSQEEVAEKLGVSRQTVSKWENDETLPDIRQSKQLAVLYHRTLDALIDFQLEVEELEQAVRSASERAQQQVDWTKLWAEKYPILNTYRQEVKTEDYARRLDGMLGQLQKDYGYSPLDAFLVLKDILAGLWQAEK